MIQRTPIFANHRSWLVSGMIVTVLTLAPLALPPFWSVNVFGRAMILGMIALSLTFLARYGGFVSLAQMLVAGISGYAIAVMVPEAIPENGLQVPYVFAIPIAIMLATVSGLIVGAIAVRTREIYLLMITLALAVGFYYFAQSNLEYLNGYEGIRNVLGPEIFGIPFRDPQVFYYSTLAVSVALYGLVLYVVRTPFGLIIQGVRDNSRRVSALGYNTSLHRIAAFGFAGFIAGCGGVLSVIYNIGIAPGQVSIHATFSILIISVIGGLGHPIGSFVGAIVYVLIDTFAADIYDRDRFNTLVGFVFLFIVLASPDGIVGLASKLGRYSKSIISPMRLATWLEVRRNLGSGPAE